MVARAMLYLMSFEQPKPFSLITFLNKVFTLLLLGWNHHCVKISYLTFCKVRFQIFLLFLMLTWPLRLFYAIFTDHYCLRSFQVVNYPYINLIIIIILYILNLWQKIRDKRRFAVVLGSSSQELTLYGNGLKAQTPANIVSIKPLP